MSSHFRPARLLRVLVRTLVVGLSAAVLAVTAFGWVQVRALDRSTPSAAVIDTPAAGRTAEQNLLLVGLDSRTDARGNPLPESLLASLNAGDASDGGGTADSLTVVHVPAGGGRATAISVPRDAYVQLREGLGKHKINSAWSRASARAIEAMTGVGPAGGTTLFAAESAAAPRPDDPAVARVAAAAGARATIGAVEDLTGLRISHFAAVNLAGFADISTAIGGVGICLRAPARDDYSGVALPAGPQRIAGAQALAFVRQRYGLPGGDLDRIARQQVFLAGATEKLLSARTLADPSAVARITDALSRSVTLDRGWDVVAFARQIQGLSAGEVTFRTVPTISAEQSTPSDGTVVTVDPGSVRRFVAAAIAADAVGPGAPLALAPGQAPVGLGTTDASSSERRLRLADADADADSDADEEQGGSGSRRSGDAGAVARPVSPTPPITAAAPGCVN